MATDKNEVAIPADAMRIAVIGDRDIGRTLGAKWATASHQVIYGVRTPEAPDTAPIADAVASAEVVVLAVPGAAAKDVLGALGEALAGKVVIDATNDVQGAGKLHALEELTDGAHTARAFNTLGWENFADPVLNGVPGRPLLRGRRRPRKRGRRPADHGRRIPARLARRRRGVRSRRLPHTTLVHPRPPARARPPPRVEELLVE